MMHACAARMSCYHKQFGCTIASFLDFAFVFVFLMTQYCNSSTAAGIVRVRAHEQQDQNCCFLFFFRVFSMLEKFDNIHIG